MAPPKITNKNDNKKKNHVSRLVETSNKGRTSSSSPLCSSSSTTSTRRSSSMSKHVNNEMRVFVKFFVNF